MPGFNKAEKRDKERGNNSRWNSTDRRRGEIF
jgi:hypothetical protein